MKSMSQIEVLRKTLREINENIRFWTAENSDFGEEQLAGERERKAWVSNAISKLERTRR